MDARPRAAGLRTFQPQHPRGQGCRLHDLPRPSRPHATDVAREVAADGVVPRLPPAAREICAAEGGRLPRGLRTAVEPDRDRKQAGRGIPDSEAHQLLDVSLLILDCGLWIWD